MPELTDAVGYVRVSQAREEMISPQLQRASIEQWARANGRRITDWVTDLDATGRNFKRKVEGLVRRVERGEVREILVYRYDRWGRNATDALRNIGIVEERAGALVSVTEPFDAETAIGRYTRTNALALAEMQSDIIGENWKSVMSHRASEGLPPNAHAARFGYRRLGRVPKEDDPKRTRRVGGEEERYVPDPALGQVLAGMYRAYISGEGSTVIARRLNDAGIPNAENRLWSGRTVLAVLDSGFGAGFLRVHNPACRVKMRPGEICKNRVLIPGRHQAVITEPEWTAYLGRRRATASSKSARARAVYPVTGLVKCGHCGGAMAATGSPKARGVYFRCIRQNKYRDCPGGGVTVPLPALLAEVKAFMAGLAENIEAQADTVKTRTMIVKGARGDADRLAAELAAVDRRLTRLALAATETDDLPAETWREAAQSLRAERDQLGRRLTAVREESAEADMDPLPAVTGIMDAWDRIPGAELNRLLRTVIRSVTAWRTGPAIRDEKGHFRPQQARLQVVPRWGAGPG